MNRASLLGNNKKYWLAAGLFVVIIAAVLIWMSQTRATAQQKYETTDATLGKLTANVSATGNVRAAQSTTLVWNSSGRVAAVNAAIGARVNADRVIASLAQGTVSQNIILAESDLVTAQQNLDHLTQSNSGVADAMQNLANANQGVQDAQDAYDSITRKRVSDELIQNTADEIDQAKSQLKRIVWFYNIFHGYDKMADGRSAKAKMTVTITNLQQKIIDLTTRYNWYTSKASPIDVEKSMAALNLAKAKQQDAQREMDRLKNGTNIDDIAAAQARVAAAQATANMGNIITPFSGTLTRAETQAGDWVTIGQVAFRIDDLSQLMVDLQISEVDINNVSTDQPVTMTFDAIPDKTYNGVVSKVNLASKAGQGGVNFGVTVAITDADELVKPGMSASVNITVKEVGDALLVPNKAIRMINGLRVVYVLKNNQPVAVNIRLGAMADINSQVVGGDLKEGDLIISNPPNATNSSVPVTNPNP